MHQSGVSSSVIFLKSDWDLVYIEQNRDVREILRNLIGCLKDWRIKTLELVFKISEIKSLYLPVVKSASESREKIFGPFTYTIHTSCLLLNT